MVRIMMWAAAAALTLAAAAGARAAEADSLDVALHKQAPAILQFLRDQKYANVGVLKFLVRVGDDGSLRDDAGGLNRNLADRLEVALVLGLDKADEDRLGILLHASDVAANAHNAKLTHRTPEGRQAFFPKSHALLFQRAWGSDDPVPADAFLTGEAVVAPDWRSMKVRIQVFDRNNAGDKEMKTLADWFPAAIDLQSFTNLGGSYARKKGVKDDDPNDTPQERQAKVDYYPPPIPAGPDSPPPDKEQEKKRQDAMNEVVKASPVQLEILYNNAPAPIHGGFVDTPNPGDKVAFHLKNTDPNKKTYGVVLKINGESSIEHQTQADRYCYKWVLAPGADITVEGFQADDDSAKAFKVLPPEASKGEEIRYGNRVGLIEMAIFREAGPADDAVVLNDDKRNVDVKPIGRGSLVCQSGRPFSLTALQDDLKDSVNPNKSPGRGVLAEGEGVVSKTTRVAFKPYPEPVDSIVVRYYKPQQ